MFINDVFVNMFNAYNEYNNAKNR